MFNVRYLRTNCIGT